MKLVKFSLAFISILFLGVFMPHAITAQSPKDTAGCPYDYTKSLPGYQYESRDAELISRAMSLSAMETAQNYRTEELSLYLDFSEHSINIEACWDSLFLHANPDIKPDISAIKRIGIDGNAIFYAVQEYNLNDTLEILRDLLQDFKSQVDSTILQYREIELLEEAVDSIQQEHDSLQNEHDSLQNKASYLHAFADSINSDIQTMKVSTFGRFLANNSSAFQRYTNLLDTIKILLKIKALPESARLTFLLLNNDSIVNNTEMFNRIEADVWYQIAHDVQGTCERFFPSLNDLEIDLECLNTLIAVGRHTEDSTTSEILPLITAFWECYWAGEENHFQNLSLDSEINIHDGTGPINIYELTELRRTLIEKEVLDTISLTEFKILNMLDDVYNMNQQGRLSQKAADVAQELLIQPMSDSQIIEIRQRFWETVKTDFYGMLTSFRSRIQGETIKDNCIEIIESINRLEDTYSNRYPEADPKNLTQNLNDLIYRFWLCQN